MCVKFQLSSSNSSWDMRGFQINTRVCCALRTPLMEKIFILCGKLEGAIYCVDFIYIWASLDQICSRYPAHIGSANSGKMPGAAIGCISSGKNVWLLRPVVTSVKETALTSRVTGSWADTCTKATSMRMAVMHKLERNMRPKQCVYIAVMPRYRTVKLCRPLGEVPSFLDLHPSCH